MGMEKEKKKFSSAYEEQERELLILTSEDVGGAGRAAGETAWRARAGFLASVDLATGQLKEERGCLFWLAEEKDRDGWIYHLKPLTIYHVKCHAERRKNLEKAKSGCESCVGAESYMLTEVVARSLQHLGLEKVLEEYGKVVEFTDEVCGRFTLERQMDWFSTEIDWLGEKCDVHLSCDVEEGQTAEKALGYFKVIYGSLPEWDKELRAFAAKQLTSTANDWLADMMEDDMEECDEEDMDGLEESDEDEIDGLEEELDEDEIDGLEEELDEDEIDGLEEESDEDEVDGLEEELDEDEIDGLEEGADEDEVDGLKDGLDEDMEDLDTDAQEEEDWYDDEFEEITEADFAKRILITSIVMEPEGDYSVYYNDDDMFWGHTIIVEGNVKTGLEQAYFAG